MASKSTMKRRRQRLAQKAKQNALLTERIAKYIRNASVTLKFVVRSSQGLNGPVSKYITKISSFGRCLENALRPLNVSIEFHEDHEYTYVGGPTYCIGEKNKPPMLVSCDGIDVSRAHGLIHAQVSTVVDSIHLAIKDLPGFSSDVKDYFYNNAIVRFELD